MRMNQKGCFFYEDGRLYMNWSDPAEKQNRRPRREGTMVLAWDQGTFTEFGFRVICANSGTAEGLSSDPGR